jgi:hypothetical protein
LAYLFDHAFHVGSARNIPRQEQALSARQRDLLLKLLCSGKIVKVVEADARPGARESQGHGGPNALLCARYQHYPTRRG